MTPDLSLVPVSDEQAKLAFAPRQQQQQQQQQQRTLSGFSDVSRIPASSMRSFDSSTRSQQSLINWQSGSSPAMARANVASMTASANFGAASPGRRTPRSPGSPVQRRTSSAPSIQPPSASFLNSRRSASPPVTADQPPSSPVLSPPGSVADLSASSPAMGANGSFAPVPSGREGGWPLPPVMTPRLIAAMHVAKRRAAAVDGGKGSRAKNWLSLQLRDRLSSEHSGVDQVCTTTMCAQLI